MSKRKNEERQSLLRILLTGSGHILSWMLHGMSALLIGALKGSWWSLRMTGRGILWSIRQTWRGTVWIVTLPWRLLRFIINGRIPTFENARQEEIFWRIKRQYRRQRFLMLHSMFYIFGLLFLGGFALHELYLQWFTTLYSNWSAVIQAGMFMGFWTVMILFHLAFVRMGNAEDRALGEALEREYTRSQRGQDVREPDLDERYERLSEPFYDEDVDYLDYAEKLKRSWR